MRQTKDVPPSPVMSLVLQIVPFNDGIDMFGEPDSSYVLYYVFSNVYIHIHPRSAYSLSGHVSISVAASYSFFESRKPIHLLLQSLVLTFEGQSEIFTHSTGYSSLRLCSITRELVPGEPLELSNESNDEDGTYRLSVDHSVGMFNICAHCRCMEYRVQSDHPWMVT